MYRKFSRALWSWKVRLKTGFDAHFRMWKNTQESGSDTQFFKELHIWVQSADLFTAYECNKYWCDKVYILFATVKKDLPSYAVKRSALWTQIVTSLKNRVSEPDSWVFFHIRKWASNPVLRRTFQLPRALKIILSNWHVPHTKVKVSLHIACYS